MKSNLFPALLMLLLSSFAASPHCDSMDGPVVKAARQALAEGNVNRVLIWIPEDDEREIKRAFERTLAVRKLNATARELADQFFFETLVRIHRAGEGAPYSGLKPIGHDYGRAIPAADKALETGDIKPLRGLLSEELGRGLQLRFQAVQEKKNFDKNDVGAGREFVRAYAAYVEHVEGLHQAARGAAHAPAVEPARAEANEHR